MIICSVKVGTDGKMGFFFLVFFFSSSKLGWVHLRPGLGSPLTASNPTQGQRVLQSVPRYLL